MKNKQQVTICFEEIESCKPCIPLGMRRSVEEDNYAQALHPVRDASLLFRKYKPIKFYK